MKPTNDQNILTPVDLLKEIFNGIPGTWYVPSIDISYVQHCYSKKTAWHGIRQPKDPFYFLSPSEQRNALLVCVPLVPPLSHVIDMTLHLYLSVPPSISTAAVRVIP